MKKLIKKKINNIFNYNQFLKHNYLKNKKFKLKNILFDNPILYRNPIMEASIIEFDHYKNIHLPFTLIKIHEISTIDSKYEDVLLFNYELSYNILQQFNKIMFRYAVNPKTNSIKGRVLGGNRNNTRIYIAVLGIIFSIKPIKLHDILNHKKRFYSIKSKKLYKKKRFDLTRIINSYKLKYLNFRITNSQISNRKQLSRISYVKFIIKHKNLKSEREKRVLSKNLKSEREKRVLSKNLKSEREKRVLSKNLKNKNLY